MGHTYLNTAAEKLPTPLPVDAYHIDTPVEQYDLNYDFPVQAMESDAVRLEPLIPSIHARRIWDVLSTEAGPAVYHYLPMAIPRTLEDFLTQLEGFRRNHTWITFAIVDKHPSGDALAGMIAYLNTEVSNLSLEVGYVVIFPQFQRTHVNTHANGLLLRYALEELRLRRVQWRANMLNKASVAAAERFGYEMEGVIQWHRVLSAGKEGVDVSDEGDGLGSPKAGPGRHTGTLSITFETWRRSVRATIDGLMARKVERAL